MKIYQRTKMENGRKVPASPYWYVDLTDPATKRRVRHSTGKTTKREAQAEAERLFRSLGTEASPLAEGRAVSIAEAVGRYLAHLETHKKPSVRLLVSLKRKLFGTTPAGKTRWHLDGARMLHTLSSEDLEQLVVHRVREGNGPQIIAHELKLLRAATRYAAGLQQRVPLALTRRDSRDAWRIPATKPRTRYLSLEEWQRLFDHMSPDRVCRAAWGRTFVFKDENIRQAMQTGQDLLVALTLCGGRTAEVSRLTWDRVDLPALAEWTRWDQEGRPGERPLVTIRLWGFKTDSERLLGAPDQVCAILARRQAEAGKADVLIFPTKNGTMRKGGAYAILKAIKACGLNSPELVAEHGRATVHSLRHTFASWLLQNGAGLEEVQEALGHSSMQMTRRYAHLAKRATAAKLGGILSQLGPAV